jgi:deazaflavin-dependent oxidoreductase (nitroreductase family)
MADDSMNERNARVLTEFRDNGGIATSYKGWADLLLLTTTGAKSGLPRTTPIAYWTFGNRLYIIASEDGAQSNPAWYFNLLARPQATAEVPTPDGVAMVVVDAIPITGARRDVIYANVEEIQPAFTEYALRASPRTIPIFELTPNPLHPQREPRVDLRDAPVPVNQTGLESFGVAFAAYRTLLAMTPPQLASKSDVSVGTINALEKGHRWPNAADAEKLEAGLNLPQGALSRWFATDPNAAEPQW